MYSLFLPASEDQCCSSFSSTTQTSPGPTPQLSPPVPVYSLKPRPYTTSRHAAPICVHDSFMGHTALGFLSDIYSKSPLTAERASSGPKRAGEPRCPSFFEMYISSVLFAPPFAPWLITCETSAHSKPNHVRQTTGRQKLWDGALPLLSEGEGFFGRSLKLLPSIFPSFLSAALGDEVSMADGGRCGGEHKTGR